MAHRVLELTLVSASELKDVNTLSHMEVYAVASVYGDPLTRQCTHTDRYGGRYPEWHETLRFAVPPTAAAASAEGSYLHVLLRTERAFGFEDRDVGEVLVPVADLLAGACGSGAQQRRCASYQVRKVQCAEHHGVLSVSYRLGPVMAPARRDTKRCGDAVGYPVTRWQPCYPPSYAYAPQYQSVAPHCPVPYVRTLVQKNVKKKKGSFALALGGGFGGLLFGNMMSSESETWAYQNAGYETTDAGGVAF
uniref:Uncharacterized protein n=1 Tax=Avena sativa TaxID=4498 RepID=A0ACD5YBD4_AVESA